MKQASCLAILVTEEPQQLPSGSCCWPSSCVWLDTLASALASLTRKRAHPVSSDAHMLAQHDHRLLTRHGFFDTERSQSRCTRSHRWVLREVQTHCMASHPSLALFCPFATHLVAYRVGISVHRALRICAPVVARSRLHRSGEEFSPY